ncbi:unnamed protein product [Prunus armeniaca]|uniref:Uncharacterized protein n=1 Tax=Prunus armeniaca TaxID=36596 RepID=A0A6J5V7T1_PRUAR|nr:unnamed protein product [Prunus armeniaca]
MGVDLAKHAEVVLGAELVNRGRCRLATSDGVRVCSLGLHALLLLCLLQKHCVSIMSIRMRVIFNLEAEKGRRISKSKMWIFSYR